MKKSLFFGPYGTKEQQASDEKGSQEIEKKVDMLESQLNTLRTENHEVKSHLKVLRRESLLSSKLQNNVGLEVSPNENNDSSVEEEEPTAKELENVEEATNLPSYEFRCQYSGYGKFK